jgi:UDP-N-acetyl-D-mannosaminuronic acid dehydrogenase
MTVLPTGRFVTRAEPDVLSGCDIYFLATDTPILPDHSFDAPRFMSGVDKIGAHVHQNCMVVIESTVPPGTMEDLVIPRLERSSGLRAGSDFLVVHCPERLRPGKLLHNLTNLTRLVGADSDATRSLAVSLYANIVSAPLRPVDYRTAEVVKTAENTARDIQIALADQLAVVCDVVGVDFRVVRDAINELWRDESLVLEAGPGVGGHCLPKDPWLLVSPLPNGDMKALVTGARAMNSFMPSHVGSIAIAMLEAQGLRATGANVSVLGVSYNANTDDTRNSPGLAVSDILASLGAEVRLHDPYVPRYAGDVVESLRGSDLAILINAHTQYRNLDWGTLRSVMRHAAVLDTRRCLNADRMRNAGFIYRSLGVGALAASSR